MVEKKERKVSSTEDAAHKVAGAKRLNTSTATVTVITLPSEVSVGASQLITEHLVSAGRAECPPRPSKLEKSDEVLSVVSFQHNSEPASRDINCFGTLSP